MYEGVTEKEKKRCREDKAGVRAPSLPLVLLPHCCSWRVLAAPMLTTCDHATHTPVRRVANAMRREYGEGGG